MRNMKFLALAGAALAFLAACETSAPYSNIIDTTGRGVGFSDYAQYMRAQEELSRIRRNQAAQARQVPQQSSGPQFANAPAQSLGPQTIGQEAVAAVRGGGQSQQQPSQAGISQFPVAQNSQAQASGAPLSGTSPIPGTSAASEQFASAAPQSAGISEQQFTPRPFGSSEPDRLIERDFVPQVRVSDAELGRQTDVPNLFVYALSTQHNVGEVRYARNHPMRHRRAETACRQFASQDLAQEAFLAAGGPERDPNHLDPDGDGFACWWDPAPFRQAARTVRARE